MKTTKKAFIVILSAALVVIAVLLIVLISAKAKQKQPQDSGIKDTVIAETTLAEDITEEMVIEDDPEQTNATTGSGTSEPNELQEITIDEEEYIVTIENNEAIDGF